MMFLNHSYCVVLAGGKGTRFWPESLSAKPKQFLPIVGEQTMIQQTLNRVTPIIPSENIYIVTGREYFRLVQDDVRNIPDENILLEPVGRNTGPGVAWAAGIIHNKDPDAVIAMLASDHVIPDREQFGTVLTQSLALAHDSHSIVTLGITPNRPETGYGYIHRGEPRGSAGTLKYYDVKRFVEKPDIERAKRFFEDGTYFWNSGMFIFRSKTLLSEIARFEPEIYQGIEGIVASSNNPATIERVFSNLPNRSIDYAVMEKTDDILVLPVTFAWSDVGSWEALYDHLPRTDGGNCSRGEHLFHGCKNTMAFGADRLIVGIGLENIIIVETDGAVLVCDKNQSQKVGEIVKMLNSNPKFKSYV